MDEQSAWPTLDAEALDELLASTGGDGTFLAQLIDAYLVDAESILRVMRTAAESGANGELERAAHTLKSSSASLGALRLAELCRGLEADARSGNVDDAAARVEAVQRELASVTVALAPKRIPAT